MAGCPDLLTACSMPFCPQLSKLGSSFITCVLYEWDFQGWTWLRWWVQPGNPPPALSTKKATIFGHKK